MRLFFHRLKKRIAFTTSIATDVAIFIGLVLIGGLGSSWYMVEAGSRLTTVANGPWVMWTSAGRKTSDPYTRAHFARRGALVLSTEVARTYIARADSDGAGLHSSCDYAINGQDLPGRWWSIAAFNSRGKLIPNALNRHVYTRDDVAIHADSSVLITLSRDVGPGNWLPTGGAGRLVVVLTVLDLKPVALTVEANDEQQVLPTIRRISCR
ncbi:MAG: DUF1214 domain-containing protein [Alphaproteobacteria bacterium]|nr:DUF1214 domain-containing protein [Alphaproteobacteria bacterium]